MWEWIRSQPAVIWWLSGLSLVFFVGTLLLIPYLVVRIPPEYFTRKSRGHTLWKDRHPVIRMILLIVKNLLGVGFVLAGIAMLFLPGQGLLTIAVGMFLVDFPGKYRFERWLIRRQPVIRAVNWLRRRAGRGEIRFDD